MNQQTDKPQTAAEDPGRQVQARPDLAVPGTASWILGIYLLLTSVVVIFLLIAIWPVQNGKDAWNPAGPFGTVITDDMRLLLIVLLAGAAGSCIGAQTSFATYVGNRSLVSGA